MKSIHSQHPEAAREIEQRLGKAQTSVQQLNEKNVAGKKALAAWDHKFRKVHGKDPEDKDRYEKLSCSIISIVFVSL